jgi:hypothetical protein
MKNSSKANEQLSFDTDTEEAVYTIYILLIYIQDTETCSFEWRMESNYSKVILIETNAEMTRLRDDCERHRKPVLSTYVTSMIYLSCGFRFGTKPSTYLCHSDIFCTFTFFCQVVITYWKKFDFNVCFVGRQTGSWEYLNILILLFFQ